MKKWKEMTKNEKWMIVIILLLLLGIATRWGYVRTQVSDSWRDMFRDAETEIESEIIESELP